MPPPGVQAWPALRAGAPVCGEVTVPPSKSLTNRYLLLAALAEGPSVVINALESRDSRLMLQALEALGATVEHIPDWEGTHESAVRISPIPLTPKAGQAHAAAGPAQVDCGLAGTVMRFLPAVAALTGRRVEFDGDPEARIRPMGAVLEGLSALGAAISPVDQPGFLPFTVESPGGLEGGEIAIDASASSQFVSGLLLAGARMRRGLTLRHTGEAVPSSEHVAMTVKVLRDSGVAVDDSEPFAWTVSPGPVPPFTARVEPDLSNAGPFLAAAAATGGEVVMRGWPAASTQIGRRWTELLPQFGAEVTAVPEPGGKTVTLTVRGAHDDVGAPQVVSPGTVDGTAELTPTVAALAALAEGTTTFTSVQHLRGHETDRIAALVAEIRRLGGEAEETRDGFRITAPVRRGGTVLSYADHRMATFGAVLGLRVDGVLVEDIGCTAKTMPTFPDLWRSLVERAPSLQPPQEGPPQPQVSPSAQSSAEQSP